VLKYGSVGEGVRRVQRAMNAAVDARLPITGVYDRATVQAVRAYQHAVRTAPNGVVADPTWAQLAVGRLRAAGTASRALGGGREPLGG
jgi:peptidoglycan hydrolase-like protein with peptidoglycan-binding domain